MSGIMKMDGKAGVKNVKMKQHILEKVFFSLLKICRFKVGSFFDPLGFKPIETPNMKVIRPLGWYTY